MSSVASEGFSPFQLSTLSITKHFNDFPPTLRSNNMIMAIPVIVLLEAVAAGAITGATVSYIVRSR